LIDLSMGTGSFAGVMRLRGLMLIPHLPSSTEVQYGYSCTSTSPHCLLGILFDSLYIFGRNISDWGDFALRNQLLWTSYFTFRKLCDSIDAGVGRLKYVTHVDTSIFFFCTSTISSQLLMGWFFATLCAIWSTLVLIFFTRDSDYIYTFSSISFWAPTNSTVALQNELSWW
jgi:hypothetical protein